VPELNKVHSPCACRRLGAGGAEPHRHARSAALLSLALLLGGALLLAGCGVRGSLEAPVTEPTETGNATPGTPGQPVPTKPSILDPLLR
jgi:hypothetical protein